MWLPVRVSVASVSTKAVSKSPVGNGAKMRHAPRSFWILLAVFCFAGILKATLPQVASGTWTSASNLAQARSNAGAVMLSDGRILIAGGDSAGGPLQSVELFGTGGGASSAAAMNVPRSRHLAVTLSDGRVLVAGGVTTAGGVTNSAEIYDPAADSWTQTGPMAQARAGATAALLQDGRVLIAGGDGSGAPSNSIEIFDPSSDNFNFAGTLSCPRTQHAMAVLQDGRVLIIGGSDGTNPLVSSDIFDPASGNISAGPSLAVARVGLSATTLLDGRIVVIGGADNNGGDLASAEIYDPATGSFALAGTAMATARQGHQAFLLPNNNNVLIFGGTSGGTAVAASELFTPQISSSGVWSSGVSATGANVTARSAATGSPMKHDGLLLAAGGSDASGNALPSTELYAFPTVKTDQADYAPGSIVTITGAGWKPGETVTLSFVESPLDDTHPSLTAIADANGNISNNQFSPDIHDINIRFYLTAVGSQSGLVALNTFTDAAGDDTTTTVSCTPNPVTAGSATTCTATVNNIASPVTNGFPQGTAAFQFTGPAGTFSFSPSNGVCNVAQIGSTNNSSCSVTLTPNDAVNGAVKANFNAANNNWKNSVSGNLNLAVTAGAFSQLQLLVPGETAAPGTSTGKTGTPTARTAGTAFNVTVNAVDANWNLINTVTQTVQLTSSDAAAVLPANAALVGGTRSFSVTLKTTPSQTITATDITDGTKAPSISPAIPVNAGAANKLAYNQQPTNANVSAIISPAITVQVQDQFGNVVTSSSVSVTLSIKAGTGTSGATLACTTGLTHNASSGVATFPDCNINTAGTNYQLHAAATGLTAVDSNQFNIISPISKLGFTTAPLTGVINQCLGPITVQTQNSGGNGTNPPSAVTVDLSISSGGTGAFFSDPGCSSSITSVSIPTSTNSASFYLKGATAGTPTTVRADDHAGTLTFATQNETINKRTTSTSLTLTPNSVTVGQASTIAVTVTDTDTTPQSNPQGTIALTSTDAGDVFGTCTLTANGANAATCSTTVTPAHVGTSPHGITATFTPTDTAHLGSSNTPAASLTVNKTDQTINFAALQNKTYGDTAFTVSATGGASGNPVTFTAGPSGVCSSSAPNGSTITITGAGTCTVTAQQAGNADYNAAADVPQSFTVNKADAIIHVTAYHATYDGNPHTATGTATGVGGADLSASLTLTGTTHTNAGDYPSDAWSFSGGTNYNDASGSVHDIIDKADAVIHVTAYHVTYDANPHTATGTATGVGGADLSASLTLTGTTHTNAGDYPSDAWSFSGGTNYNDASGSVHDIIDKADAVIHVTAYHATYDGNPHTATGTATGVGGADLSASLTLTGTTHTNAGDYPSDAWSFNGGTNYNDASGSVHDIIDKADAVIHVTAYHATYDGNPHTATGTATGVGGADLSASLTLTGTTHTNAGDYPSDAWSFSGGTNYNDASGSVHDIIDKAPSTTIVNGGGTFTYDGTPHPATVTVTGAGGLSLTPPPTYSGPCSATGAPVNVPETPCTASYTYTGDPNHDGSSGSTIITIIKANQMITWANPASIVLGTALSGTQLNATVAGVSGGSAPGALTYTPASGTVLPVGSQTLRVDAAATINYNSAYKTVQISVLYSIGLCLGSPGHTILQPINSDGSSVFKQKSTVPAKFRVCDANGNSIGTPGVVTSFRLTGQGTGTVVPVPDEAVDSTTPDTTFRWDPTAQQWIFNMNTKNLPDNMTYQYTITLNDGSFIIFVFGLK
jgi:Kelch motif